MLQTFPLAAAAVLLAVLSIAAGLTGGAAMAGGALLGAVAGFGLYHSSFGFTGAWRQLVRERRSSGVRAQMLLIGATALVTYPLIGWEAQTSWNMNPVVMPITLASAFGAFLFGAGMQLGGGCASGTLFTVGGGSTRMVVTLIAFIAGSVIATAHLHEFWFQLDDITGIPNIPAFSVISQFGTLGGMVSLAVILVSVWSLTLRLESRRHGSAEPIGGLSRGVIGPWSKATGAIVLAGVGIGCFLMFQRPWGITSGFALWGAHALEALGFSVRGWGYWSGWRSNQLDSPLLANSISVMNFGIILGAFGASALAGRFAPAWRLTRRDLITAVVGGLMMGYGARLAFGCNIGAYLGGLVSGSAHGLWWLIWGFAGSWIGVELRSRIGMDPPVSRRSTIAAGPA
ncbi:MAG: YeeE/YedE family protein [Pseudomonadota bacterium]